MSTTFDRPKEIIGYCLAPLQLDPSSDAYQEAYRRLEHVVKTLQLAASKGSKVTSVDFSQMRTLTINEDAHGENAETDV
jgi:hypothetical protein